MRSIVIQEPIVERSFAEWIMGYTCMTRQELTQIADLNDFFVASNAHAVEVDRSRASKLLTAFRNGRWRTRLSGATAQAFA